MPTLIHIHTCLHTYLHINIHIKKVLPETNQSLNEFMSIGSKYLSQYRKNCTTLQQHSSLLELLEVPQLMDTCVRNNLYDEAIDLMNFANTLKKRHVR